MKSKNHPLFPRCLFLAGLLIAVSAFDAAAQNQNTPPQVTCAVTMARRTRIEGGDWDDKTQKVTFQIAVTNKSFSKPTGPLQMVFYTFGVSVHDRHIFKLLQRETYDFELEPKATFNQTTPTVELKYDTTNMSFGETYRGWMLQITDGEGRSVLEQFSMPIISDTRNLPNLEVGAYYDKDGKPVPSPRRK